MHLLCRALRLAPACYRHILLAAANPRAQLTVTGGVILSEDHEHAPGQVDYARDEAAHFSSAVDLAAAMRQFANAEGLSVHLSADEGSIMISRPAVA